MVLAKWGAASALSLMLVLACCPSGTQAPSVPDANPGKLDGSSSNDGSDANRRPRVIVLIGDGMGRELETAASHFARGAPKSLSWHSLERRGQLLTASESGITDSAASTTAMATGEFTFNGRLAMSTEGQRLSSVFELASARELSTGVVTTATVSHATPAAFTSHALDRYDLETVLDDQTGPAQPSIMLGGGRADFDSDRISALEASGATVVYDADALAAAVSVNAERIVGLFADSHFPYVGQRSSEPNLTTMTMAAIEALDHNPRGFVLVVEAARIDRACHDRQIDLALGEVVEFDNTVAAVRAWAANETDVTLVVTSDHETGGLHVENATPAGVVPPVTWRWGNHSNARVSIYGEGPGTEAITSEPGDPRTVFSIVNAAITGTELEPLPRKVIANGHLGDLRYVTASQNQTSDFGNAGRLDRLFVDADENGFAVGAEGIFSMTSSSLVFLIDRDYGNETGARVFADVSTSSTNTVDVLLSNFELDASSIAGFGAEYAIVSVAGIENTREVSWPGGGLRSLRASDGAPLPPPLAGVALNYDDGVRGAHGLAVGSPLSGVELKVGFDRLFADTGGSIPPGTTIAVAVIMTSVLAGQNSNQALPPFQPNGSGLITGVVIVELDANGDGELDPTLGVGP